MAPRQLINKYQTTIVTSLITFFIGIVGTAFLNSVTNANEIKMLSEKVATLSANIIELSSKKDAQDQRQDQDITADGNRITTLETEYTFLKPQK